MDEILKSMSNEEFMNLFNQMVKEKQEREFAVKEQKRKELAEALDKAMGIMKDYGFEVRILTDYDGYIDEYDYEIN